MSFFKKIFSKEKKESLDKGLEKSKSSFFTKLSKVVAGKSKVDDDVLDNLTILIALLSLFEPVCNDATDFFAMSLYFIYLTFSFS